MARPKKKGLDYFPVDTDIFQDVKIRRLIRRHKQAGFLLYMQLLCDIYRHSFYIQLTDDYCFDLAEQWNLTERGVKTMIRSMIEFGLFYNNLHRKDILTSCAIQERYFMVKGKNINLEDGEKELLLTSICAEKPGVLDAKSTQRKEKERKEKENISTSTTARESENLEPTDYSFNGKCARLRKDLLKDEEWLYSVSVLSGKGGKTVLERLPGAMELFEMHLVSIGETGTILNINDYKRRFQSWWRCLNFETKEGILARNQSASRPQTKPVSRIDEMQRVCEEAKILTRKMLKLE